MNNKRLIISSTISILLVSILLIGSTYSIFTSTEIDEKENVCTTGNLVVDYMPSSDNVIMEDTTPMSIYQSIKIKPYRITITNNGNVAYKINIILNDTTASEKINYQYIMTQVGKLEPKLLSECSDNVLKSDIIIGSGGALVQDFSTSYGVRPTISLNSNSIISWEKELRKNHT